MFPSTNQDQPELARSASTQNMANPTGSESTAGTSVQTVSTSLQPPALAQTSTPIPSDIVQLQAAGQVDQLIARYGNDPYRLNEALSNLRSAYLADQYHITPTSAEDR